jgi:uncharacterized protein
VHSIAQSLTQTVSQLIGNSPQLAAISPANFVNEQFGLPTIEDIIKELDKPGRDPRPEFCTATFKEGIESIKDLKPEMILEGVITNVTNFGAFVDIGVHQDGLVHISALADRFVRDPRDVVKTGQIVKVKVTEVDSQRKRIALTMKLDAAPQTKPTTSKHSTAKESTSKHGSLKTGTSKQSSATQSNQRQKSAQPARHNSGFADAFSQARKIK